MVLGSKLNIRDIKVACVIPDGNRDHIKMRTNTYKTVSSELSFVSMNNVF